MSEEHEALERVRRLRACAARLREAAPLTPGGRVSRDFVEELAKEFDRHAETLERSVS
jgi:hypothetical protein